LEIVKINAFRPYFLQFTSINLDNRHIFYALCSYQSVNIFNFQFLIERGYGKFKKIYYYLCGFGYRGEIFDIDNVKES
jgi:hypothetical protein